MVSRRTQALVTFALGLFLAGYVVVAGRFDVDPGMYRGGAYLYLNHLIDTWGLPLVALGIVAVASVAALATLALPGRRR